MVFMGSIWGNVENDSDDFTGQVRNFVEEGGGKGSAAPRPSRPPANAEERRLHVVFTYLRGADNYFKKAEFAADVLNGEFGVKNELLARLMMGPREFEDVLKDPRDIIPPLIELLNNKEVDIRVKVAQVFAERGDERVLFGMYTGLNEEAYWARYSFSMALAKIAGRLDNLEADSGIHAAMQVCAERNGGISPALLLVKMHLGRLRCPDDDAKGIPSALNKPPLAAPRAAVERPDTTARMFTGKK